MATKSVRASRTRLITMATAQSASTILTISLGSVSIAHCASRAILVDAQAALREPFGIQQSSRVLAPILQCLTTMGHAAVVRESI